MARKKLQRPTLEQLGTVKESSRGRGERKSHPTYSIVFKTNANATQGGVVNPEHVGLLEALTAVSQADDEIQGNNELARDIVFAACGNGLVEALGDVRFAQTEWQAAHVDADKTLDYLTAEHQVSQTKAQAYLDGMTELRETARANYKAALESLMEAAQEAIEDMPETFDANMARKIQQSQRRQARRDAVENLDKSSEDADD